jgi:N-acetylglucosaminyl-diphospho-decaprenol L-rhamnosyltransferase
VPDTPPASAPFDPAPARVQSGERVSKASADKLVSVVILSYRTPLLAVKCVENLLRQTIADDLEIIVVDNHSDDDSVGILRNRLKDMPVRLIETRKNFGFGGGNNYASRYASGEFILILNPDTEPESDGIERLIAELRADENIGIIAPKLMFDDGVIRDSYRTFPTMLDIIIKRTFLKRIFPGRLRRYLQYDGDPIRVRDIDWVVGAFMLMHRSLFEELEGFDERFFLFFEDTDLCRRCWQKGKRVVYYPEVQAADGKKRLSGRGIIPLIRTPAGRAHIASALRYFWKWRGEKSVG